MHSFSEKLQKLADEKEDLETELDEIKAGITSWIGKLPLL